MGDCVFCKLPLSNGEATVVLREKGCDSIIKAAEARGENKLVKAGQTVHTKCRKDYCNPTRIASHLKQSTSTDASRASTPVLRSQEQKFSFQENCLFCGQPAKYDGKKKGYEVFPVRTKDFQDSVREVCLERDDSWALKILARLEYASDLHAADAIYHQQCSVNFRTKKQIPQPFDEEKSIPRKKGRPHDIARSDAFHKVAKYLEQNDDEQITVGDLTEKMKVYLEEDKGSDGMCEPYTIKHMKKKLFERFGDDVIITEINGRPNVVTFRPKASNILNDFLHASRKDASDIDHEKIRLVKTAAKLIKADIKDVQISKETYPSCDDISSAEQNVDILPETLRLLLNELFVGKTCDLKIAAIGQAIMQAARPRVLITPLQIGLGIQMHHQFASRFLLDTLSNLGFCSSYQEVKMFESSAAISRGTGIPGFVQGHFVQYVADNVDHNIRTIDGHNTFHGMGIIAGVTPGTTGPKPVPRVVVTQEDVAKVGHINIHVWRSMEEAAGLSSLTYEKPENTTNADPASNLELLCKVSRALKPKQPGWSGLMQLIHKGNHPGKSSVVFMPMIDMSPWDMSCVYSTLKFVCDQAKSYNVSPIITFDQPLWWKAMNIIESEPQESDLHQVILRLGGFHTQMSFLGCIGHLMAGSGLEELLETIYAKNAVVHMLSGKATARAVRGHFLVDAALNTMILSEIYKCSLPPNVQCDEAGSTMSVDSESPAEDRDTGDPDNTEVSDMDHQQEYESQAEDDSTNLQGGPKNPSDVTRECTVIHEDLQQASQLLEKMVKNEISIEEIEQASVLKRMDEKMKEWKDKMRNLKTAGLWFQYMDMIDILRQFIMAERTGNWRLHLETLSMMLPYLASSGHNLYVKSINLYLQKMSKLEQDHNTVFKYFEEGLHVMRRSDRLWAGLSTDLIIEQVLMRSMKTSGGLTRGRGMTESQRVTWLLSMPSCAEVNSAMQEVTGTSFTTSEQHKESSQARIERDHKDTEELESYLQNRSPFTSDPSLRNIASGVTADSSVNVDKAKDIGLKILQKMDGANVAQYTFRRNDQAVTLGAKHGIKVDGENVQVAPELLFQRYIAAAESMENREEIFKYELCTHPPALFDSMGMMRKANKPALADAMWSQHSPEDTSVSHDVQYVLDGGSLLQRIPWPRGTTYSAIANLYADYVQKKYGTPSVIVFDGYEGGPSTKDSTHQRRSKGHMEPTINFADDMICKSQKDHFLANKANKQKMINLIGEKLKDRGFKVVHCDGDADLMIVQTGVQAAKTQDTVVVGEDTDLLVLLCHHADPESHRIIFRSESRQTSKQKKKVWNIQALKRDLGFETCKHILFGHAILGCDTTSSLFGIGKAAVLKLITKNPQFQQHAAVFTDETATKEEIETAGHAALLTLYNGRQVDNIDHLRHERLCQKVATSSIFVHPQVLPPSASATKFHSFRVYLQVQEWMGRAGLIPTDWGWQMANGRLIPIETDLPPAPSALLNVIRCNCKTDCTSARCSCKKHGLQCSLACGECRGVSCANAPHPEIGSSIDEREH